VKTSSLTMTPEELKAFQASMEKTRQALGADAVLFVAIQKRLDSTAVNQWGCGKPVSGSDWMFYLMDMQLQAAYQAGLAGQDPFVKMESL